MHASGVLLAVRSLLIRMGKTGTKKGRPAPPERADCVVTQLPTLSRRSEVESVHIIRRIVAGQQRHRILAILAGETGWSNDRQRRVYRARARRCQATGARVYSPDDPACARP